MGLFFAAEKEKKNRGFLSAVAVVGLGLSLLFSGDKRSSGTQKISRPGMYAGYSQPLYEEWQRISRYVRVRDGTKLAVDIFRPSRGGAPVSKPLPAIWTYHRYHRAKRAFNGKEIPIVSQVPWLKTLLRHGYIIAACDGRGSGASFGHLRGAFTLEEALDTYDITEWLARQPWCDKNVGMFGVSYLGITQYMAAGMAPPHLKAVMPGMAMFDLYSFVYPGGVFQNAFISEWSQMVKSLDTVIPSLPVDEDGRSKLLKKAIGEHRKNVYPMDYSSAAKYRDSRIEGNSIMPYLDWSPHHYLKDIQKSGSQIAIYHVAGWFDMWPRDALAWFTNVKNPQKILIGPWPHEFMGSVRWKETLSPLIGHEFDFDIGSEHLRWYDHWLKGIDNGIMDEPPIHYFTMGAPEKKAWRDAWQWPLPEEKPSRFYFRKGPSGSVQSINDGLLSEEAPQELDGCDVCAVDYTASSGRTTRWHNGRGGDFSYADMAMNDRIALTYTSRPLEKEVEVTGHPLVSLWVSSTAQDGDFFVYLEEVDASGYSHYVSEGVLQASHRKLSAPPFHYMELPYHRSFEEDITALDAHHPSELVFDLLPTSNIFDAGHRIRITVACADQNNFQTPDLSPPPKVSLYRNKAYASSILLPLIPNKSEKQTN